MNLTTHHDAPAQFVEAVDIRLAVRRLHRADGFPFVFGRHSIDKPGGRDPAVIGGYAMARQVVGSDSPDAVRGPLFRPSALYREYTTTYHTA